MKLLWRVIVAIFILVAAKVALDSYQIIKLAAGGEHIRIDPSLYFNLSYVIFGCVLLMFFSDVYKKIADKRNKQYKF